MKTSRLIWLLAVLSLPCISTAAEDTDAVRLVAEQYCSSESSGDEEKRAALIVMSPVQREHNARLPLMAEHFDPLSEPIVVIRDCHVAEVKSLAAGHAYAVIESYRLALSRGVGMAPPQTRRTFVRDINPEDSFRIDLVLKGKDWKVIDPPMPRFGISALTALYKSEVALAGQIKKPSKPQQQHMRYLKDQLQMVEALSDVK